MVIKNPTINEVFEAWFNGEQMFIQPGQVIRVDDARGNHLISELGPRGLIKLEYGDAGEIEEQKTLAGREKNRDFKRKQVIVFNQENERRNQRKQAMIEPQPHIIAYAAEVGLKVYEPFAETTEETKASSAMFEKLEAANDEIKKKDEALAALTQQVAALTQLVHASLGKPSEAPLANYGAMDPEQEQAILRKLQSLNKANFSRWLQDNKDQIGLMSPAIQDEVKSRHERFFGSAVAA